MKELLLSDVSTPSNKQVNHEEVYRIWKKSKQRAALQKIDRVLEGVLRSGCIPLLNRIRVCATSHVAYEMACCTLRNWVPLLCCIIFVTNDTTQCVMCALVSTLT